MDGDTYTTTPKFSLYDAQYTGITQQSEPGKSSPVTAGRASLHYAQNQQNDKNFPVDDAEEQNSVQIVVHQTQDPRLFEEANVVYSLHDANDNDVVDLTEEDFEEDEDWYYDEDDELNYDEETEYVTDAPTDPQHDDKVDKTDHGDPAMTNKASVASPGTNAGPSTQYTRNNHVNINTSGVETMFVEEEPSLPEVSRVKLLLRILWNHSEVRRLWFSNLLEAKPFRVSFFSLIWAVCSCGHCLYFSLYLISAAAGYQPFNPQEPLINSAYFGIFMGLLNAALVACMGVLIDVWNIALHFLSVKYPQGMPYAHHVLWFCDNYDYLIRVYLNYYLYCYANKINITNHGSQVFELLDASGSTEEKPLEAADVSVSLPTFASTTIAPAGNTGSANTGTRGHLPIGSNTPAPVLSLAIPSGSDTSSSTHITASLTPYVNPMVSPGRRMDSDVLVSLGAPVATGDEDMDSANNQSKTLNELRTMEDMSSNNITPSIDPCATVTDNSSPMSPLNRSASSEDAFKGPLDMSAHSGSDQQLPPRTGAMILPQVSRTEYNLLEKNVYNFFSSLESRHICQPQLVHSTMHNIYKALGMDPNEKHCMNDQRPDDVYHPYNITYNAFRRTVAAMKRKRVEHGEAGKSGLSEQQNKVILLHQRDKDEKRTKLTAENTSSNDSFWVRLLKSLKLGKHGDSTARVRPAPPENDDEKIPAISSVASQLHTSADGADTPVRRSSARVRVGDSGNGDDSESTDDEEIPEGEVLQQSVCRHRVDVNSDVYVKPSHERVCEEKANSTVKSTPSSLTDPNCTNASLAIQFDRERYLPEQKYPLVEIFKVMRDNKSRFRVIRVILKAFFFLSFLITIAVPIPSPKFHYGSVNWSVLFGGSLTVTFFFIMLTLAMYLGKRLLPALYWSTFNGNEVLDIMKQCDRLAYIRAGEIMVMLRNRVKNDGIAFATLFANANKQDFKLFTRDPFRAEAHLDDIVTEDYAEDRVSLSAIPEEGENDDSDAASIRTNATTDTKRSIRTATSKPSTESSHDGSLTLLERIIAPSPSGTRNTMAADEGLYPQLLRASAVNTQKFMQALSPLVWHTWKTEYSSSKARQKLPSQYKPTFIDTDKNAFIQLRRQNKKGPIVPRSRETNLEMKESALPLQVLFLRMKRISRSQYKRLMCYPPAKANSKQKNASVLQYNYRNTQYPESYNEHLTQTYGPAYSVQNFDKSHMTLPDRWEINFSDVGYATKKPSLLLGSSGNNRSSFKSSGRTTSRVRSLQSSTYDSQSEGMIDDAVSLKANSKFSRNSRTKSRKRYFPMQEFENDNDDADIYNESGHLDVASALSGDEQKVVRDIDCAPVDYSGFEKYVNEVEYDVEKKTQIMAMVDARYCIIHAKIHQHSHRCNRSLRRHTRSRLRYKLDHLDQSFATNRDGALLTRGAQEPCSLREMEPSEGCVSVDGNSTDVQKSQFSVRLDIDDSSSKDDSPLSPTKPASVVETCTTATSEAATNAPTASITRLPPHLSLSHKPTEDYYSSLPALSVFTNTSARLVYPTLVIPSALNVPLPIPNSPFPPHYDGNLSNSANNKDYLDRLIRNTDEYTSDAEKSIDRALTVCKIAIFYCNMCIMPSAFLPFSRHIFLIYAALNICITSAIMWIMLKIIKDDSLKDTEDAVKKKISSGVLARERMHFVFVNSAIETGTTVPVQERL